MIEELWISGEAQRNADGTSWQQIIKQCRVGETVTLLREPSNRYDGNAVAVLTRHGQIGYVARDDAEEVARRLDWGEQPECMIARILGGTRDKPNLGVVITVSWLEDWRTVQRRIARLEQTNSTEVLDLHFAIQGLIEATYADRNTDPEALDAAIAACERQIALAPRAAQAFRRAFPKTPLPAHVGFRQLAIIREKQRQFDEAIALCRQAKQQGWTGDWEKRIDRCQKRAARS